MRFRRTFIGLLIAALLALGLPTVKSSESAFAYTAGSGYAATDYVTGFPTDNYARGPIGLAFDPAGNLYVIGLQDPLGSTSVLYKFGPGGGAASAAAIVGSNLPSYTFGLAFGSDGKLYASNLFNGTVIQLDTSTGAVVRTVANIGCFMRGIATDPISGDLFVASSCGIERISNYASGPGTVTEYTPSLQKVDGINFGPDGTLYAASGDTGSPVAIAGTASASPGAVLQVYPAIPYLDGIGVAIPSPSSHSGFLLVNRNDGTITKVDASTNPATLTDVFTGGSRGDFVTTGSDGCLYATQTDRIIKVTNADGTCSLYPPDSFLKSGTFVLGDGTATSALANGSTVTWWGAQWRKSNQLSGGAAPASFKGFADTASTAPPSCGGTWATRPGNSSSPPSSVPPVMAVVVASAITQAGDTISGNIQQIVLVQTNSGYGPNPGHDGTGKIIAVLCHA